MEGEDPVTLTMAATAGAGLLSAGSAVAGGIQANQAGKVAQQQAQTEAAAAQQQAGAEIGSQMTEAGRTVSRVEAGAGAAGITQESAMPSLSEDASQARIRAAYARFSGNLASAQDIFGGKLAANEGNQQLTAGIIKGATNILGAASNIGQIKLGGARGWGSGTW